MISTEDVVERIDQAIDVPPFIDNCFFYCLALYYLANNLPFPPDLFDVHHVDPDFLIRLKSCILNWDDLESLSLKKVVPDECLVEKTLILGVFLRSFFIKQLLEDKSNQTKLFLDKTHAEGMLEEHDISFMHLVSNYREWGEADPQTFDLQHEEHPLYQANRSFFSSEISVGSLNDDEVLSKASNYWDEIGYAKYCSYFNGNIKICYTEVLPVLEKKLNIPFMLYDQKGELIAAANSSAQHPPFELVLRDNHYWLLPTVQTAHCLAIFQGQYAQYMRERRQILQQRNILAAANKSFCLLLSVTLPFSATGYDPLHLLVERVETLFKQNQNDNGTANEYEMETVNSPLLQKKNEKVSLNSPKPIPWAQRLKLRELKRSLQALDYKGDEFAQRGKESEAQAKYSLAENAAKNLYVELSKELTTFEQSSMDAQAFQIFYGRFIETIKQKGDILKWHRDNNYIIANALGLVAGIGVVYGVAVLVDYLWNGKVTFFQTRTEKILDQIIRAAQRLENRPKVHS